MVLWIGLGAAGVAVLGLTSTVAALVAIAAEVDRDGLLDGE